MRKAPRLHARAAVKALATALQVLKCPSGEDGTSAWVRSVSFPDSSAQNPHTVLIMKERIAGSSRYAANMALPCTVC